MEDKEYFLFKDKFDGIFFGDRKWLFIARLFYASIFLTFWGYLYERKDLYKVQFLGDDYSCWVLIFPILFSFFLTVELADRRLFRWFINFLSNFFTFWLWLKIYLAEKLYSEVIVDSFFFRVFRSYTDSEKFKYCSDTWDYINLIYGETMSITLDELFKICDKSVGMSGIFYYSLDLWRDKKAFIVEALKKSNVVEDSFSLSNFISQNMSISTLGNAIWFIIYLAGVCFFSYGVYRTICPNKVDIFFGPMRYPDLDSFQDIICDRTVCNANDNLLLVRRLINDNSEEARVLLAKFIKRLYPIFNNVSDNLITETRQSLDRAVLPGFESVLMSANDINVLELDTTEIPTTVFFGPSKYPDVMDFLSRIIGPQSDNAQETLTILRHLSKDFRPETDDYLFEVIKQIFPFFSAIAEAPDAMVDDTRRVFLRTVSPNLENLLMQANDYNVNF